MILIELAAIVILFHLLGFLGALLALAIAVICELNR